MSEGKKKVSLKLLIDTKANKVMFAEARKDFVDFLFNILSLPIGNIIELCSKEGKVGCLSDLYKSIDVLDVDYFEPNITKNKVTELVAIGGNSLDIPQNLLLLGDTSTEKKYYRCANTNYNNCRAYVTDTANATCPLCSREMSTAATYVKAPTATKGSGGVSQKGYVKGVVTYMVMDNLEVKPMSTISCIALINKFGVDVSALLEKEVHVGVNEWIAILKASLET